MRYPWPHQSESLQAMVQSMVMWGPAQDALPDLPTRPQSRLRCDTQGIYEQSGTRSLVTFSDRALQLSPAGNPAVRHCMGHTAITGVEDKAPSS